MTAIGLGTGLLGLQRAIGGVFRIAGTPSTEKSPLEGILEARSKQEFHGMCDVTLNSDFPDRRDGIARRNLDILTPNSDS